MNKRKCDDDVMRMLNKLGLIWQKGIPSFIKRPTLPPSRWEVLD